MYNLNEVARGGTICLSKAGLKVGNSDSKDIDIAAPNGAGVDYMINGVMYHKADAADIPLTAGDVVPAGYTAIFLILLDASGTLSSVMSTPVLTSALEAGNAVIQFPTPTANTCPIGYVRVKNATVNPFTTGTTGLDAASITDTYVDLGLVPTAPLNA